MTNKEVPEWEERKDQKYLRNTYWKFPKFDQNIHNVHNQGVQNSQGLIYQKNTIIMCICIKIKFQNRWNKM